MKKANVTSKQETQLGFKETNESRLALVLACIFLSVLIYYVVA